MLLLAARSPHHLWGYPLERGRSHPRPGCLLGVGIRASALFLEHGQNCLILSAEPKGGEGSLIELIGTSHMYVLRTTNVIIRLESHRTEDVLTTNSTGSNTVPTWSLSWVSATGSRITNHTLVNDSGRLGSSLSSLTLTQLTTDLASLKVVRSPIVSPLLPSYGPRGPNTEIAATV